MNKSREIKQTCFQTFISSKQSSFFIQIKTFILKNNIRDEYGCWFIDYSALYDWWWRIIHWFWITGNGKGELCKTIIVFSFISLIELWCLNNSFKWFFRGNISSNERIQECYYHPFTNTCTFYFHFHYKNTLSFVFHLFWIDDLKTVVHFFIQQHNQFPFSHSFHILLWSLCLKSCLFDNDITH